uniref:hypothetical protein n=1 Tax=Parerythrobacter lutipelagi TaxID=1964208 RepID=UPI00137608A0|nr:hypothetical protein [Parerythrobacter lutipelagi]
MTRLGNRTVLAVGQFSALRLLNSHPAIETAGPINIDSERFAQFVAIAKRRHQASR